MENIRSTIVVILFSLLFVSVWGFIAAIHPDKLMSTTTPRDYGIAYENINFLTQDNVEIRGWFIPNANPKAKTIILLHGYPADKGNILASRIFLHAEYNLLFLDFRYFGESGGYYTTVGRDEILDLKAAIAYLEKRGIYEVGVWGLSLGGAVAIMAAPTTPQIKAIVAESSYARLDWMTYEYYHFPVIKHILGQITRLWAWLFFGYDVKSVSPATAATQIKIPLLLIHSKKDTVVPFEHGLLLEQSSVTNPYLKVLFSNDTVHGEPMQNYQQIIRDFFGETLK